MVQREALDRLIDTAIRDRRPIVLDASALLEFLSGGSPMGASVARILEDTSIPIVHSTVTISEVLVRPFRAGEVELVQTLRLSLEFRAKTEVVDFDSEQAVATAKVRAETNLKLPDCAVVALARTRNAIGIVGADRKWRTRALGVPFYYLPDMLEAEKG